jgi:hypothetical protein
MRRILTLTGVLGGGTALVFVLAALTSALFPNGTTVSTSWNGGFVQPLDLIVQNVAPQIAPSAPFAGPVTNAPGVRIVGSTIVADDTVAGGMVKIQVDADGNPVPDANGNPVIDTTGVQP